jgi:hypothetical protein
LPPERVADLEVLQSRWQEIYRLVKLTAQAQMAERRREVVDVLIERVADLEVFESGW